MTDDVNAAPREDASDGCTHPPGACKWNIWNSRFQCHRCGASDLIQMPDEATTTCAVAGCNLWPVDVRGPICVGETYHWVCTEHWEGILKIVGEQLAMEDGSL